MLSTLRIANQFLVVGVFLNGFSASAPGASAQPSQQSLPERVGTIPPAAKGGPDFSIGVGVPARFYGYGASPDSRIIRYTWDFDGDGSVDIDSEITGVTEFTFQQTGVYPAVLSVTDESGTITRDSVEVTVTLEGEQVFETESPIVEMPEPLEAAAGDGVVTRFALMLNGGSEARFWNDVKFMYSVLVQDYQFLPQSIYLLNNTGTDPFGGNPDQMIDHTATFADLEGAFNELAELVDGDDELFVWVTDHGHGYMGPYDPFTYGYLDSNASVQPGDEQDYLESEFKLRALHTSGNHGMEVFRVTNYYSYTENAEVYFRIKYVSHFEDLDFEALGLLSDGDVFLEELFDYLLGDTDKDGKVETSLGEVVDYDRDGVPPYDPVTDSYDDGDWGLLDTFIDDLKDLNTTVPGTSYMIFDAGFDNHIDIDLNYDLNNLEVDGTDLDNQGLFDGLDVNDDGDMDDWVSIDEKFLLYTGGVTDDEFAAMLQGNNARVISFFMLPCHSGGFINDLSAPNRVLSAATKQDAVSYGNLFTELFTGSFHGTTSYGYPVNADQDGNGHISMLEAFNYAAANDTMDEIPQYDDNGDGISQPYPVPAGGDGVFGSTVYLDSWETYKEVSIDILPGVRVNAIDRTSAGLVPVAIHSTAGFSSPKDLVWSSLTFGRSGNEPSLHLQSTGSPDCLKKDVNRDRRPDLVCRFEIPLTGFICGDTAGVLRGKTLDGIQVKGQDAVVIRRCP
jgi:hypothetical protein